MPDEQDRINVLNSLVTLGQGAIKAAMFVNGAGAAALLAFIGQIWSEDNADSIIHTLALSIGIFAIGVIFGGLSTILAYFVQLYSYNYTINSEQKYWKMSECCRHIVVVFVIFSYLSFIVGIIFTLLEFCRTTIS